MDRKRVREIASSYLDKGDPKRWFDALYAEASERGEAIPWADMSANPHLVSWLTAVGIQFAGGRVLVVGCGLGDDAELLASRGFDVTAFDISATAVEWCRQRFPETAVDYVAADLLEPLEAWRGRFDLVVEAYTLQVLPTELCPAAMWSLASFLAPGGQLLVIARGREPDEDRGAMPWPLTEDELNEFVQDDVREESFEDFFDDETPPVRRFRVVYRRVRA